MAGPIWKDSVVETSTTTGTGDITLAGALTGFETFDANMSVGDECWYLIEAVDGSGNRTGEWETGWGTYSATGVLTRTVVKESSNADAAVNFSAGTKRVMITLSADAYRHKGCLVKKSIDHTAQNFTTATAIIWDVDVLDTHGFHDTGVNTSRITLPGASILTAKYIELAGQVTISNITADGWLLLAIYESGNPVFSGAGRHRTEAGATTMDIQVRSAVIAPATETAYYELFLQTESDTSIDIEADTSWFQLKVIE